MGDLNQIADRSVAQPPRWAIGSDPFRMLGLQTDKPLHQAIVVEVADGRLGQDIIEMIVMPQLISESRDFLGC